MANKGSAVLKAFRYGVRFSERCFRNIGVQIRWIWNTNSSNIGKIHAWRVSNDYHPSVEHILNGVMIALSISVLLPILIIWAGIKSL